MNTLSQPTLIELLRLLMRNTGTSVVSCIALAIVLVFALENDQNQWQLGLWAGCTILIKLVSAQYSRHHLKHPFGTDKIPTIIIGLTILNILDAIAWGSLAWVAMDTASVSGSIMIISVLAAIAGGSMSSLAPVWQIFAVFGITLLGTTAIKLYLMHDPSYYALAVAAALYIPALIGQARNGHHSARTAIELRFTNLSLIEQLRAETYIANQAQEQAKAANLAKSQFLAAASHDLRQPIHAQKLFLGALARSDLTDWQRNSLDKALVSGDTVTEMLNTLLDASRIEAGTITPYQTTFQLQTLLQKLEINLSPLADEKNLVYRSRDCHHAVLSDPVLLEQILRNLIANAIRYTNQGGILVGCRQRGQHLLIEVWDTGIGIDPALHDKIFSEFFQANNPERDRHKGFGLGLAIAKGLAHTLDHTLSLRSALGKGSCFSLRVPIAQNVLQNRPFTTVTLPTTKQELALTVLIIDDDDDVREAMHALFTLWGCPHILMADGITSALQVIQQHTPHIILSDYRLRHNTTGADAIHQVRQQLQTNTPALLITGDTSPQRLQEALATGIPLLHKPVSTDQLYDTIVSLTQTHAVPTT